MAGRSKKYGVEQIDQFGRETEIEFRLRRLERILELISKKVRDSDNVCHMVLFTSTELEDIESDILRELNERYTDKKISIIPEPPGGES